LSVSAKNTQKTVFTPIHFFL